MKLEKIRNKLNKIIDNVDRHEIFMISGSIEHTTALALAPFLLILLSIASILGSEMQEILYNQVSISIGHKAGQTIFDIIQNSKKHSSFSGISGIIGFLILLISASAIFSQLRFALNKINDHENAKDQSGILPSIKDRFFSMG